MKNFQVILLFTNQTFCLKINVDNFFVYFYSKKILRNFLSSNKQKVTSNGQKVTINEQKVTSNEQIAKSNKQRAKSNEQQAESNEQRAKSSASICMTCVTVYILVFLTFCIL